MGSLGQPSSQPSHAEMAALCNAHRTWTCTLNFQESYCHGDASSVVSLVDRLFPTGKGDYMFPECYCGPDSEKRLIMEIKLAALLDGFVLVTSNRKPQSVIEKDSRNSSRAFSIRLECQHFRVRRYETPDETRKRKVSSTKAATNAQCCGFSLVVYRRRHDALDYPDRWFLAATRSRDKAASCGTHTNHFRLDPEDIKVSTSLMDPESKKLAMQCSQLHFSSGQTAALIAMRDSLGIAWDAKQISYLSRKDDWTSDCAPKLEILEI